MSSGEESKIEYKDLAELMRHNLISVEVVERQTWVMKSVIVGILILTVIGFILCYTLSF